MGLRWTATTIAGAEHFCAPLPDGRIAYVEPSAKQPGQWRLRIVKRPGQRLADFYLMRPSARACKAWVAAWCERVAARSAA